MASLAADPDLSLSLIESTTNQLTEGTKRLIGIVPYSVNCESCADSATEAVDVHNILSISLLAITLHNNLRFETGGHFNKKGRGSRMHAEAINDNNLCFGALEFCVEPYFEQRSERSHRVFGVVAPRMYRNSRTKHKLVYGQNTFRNWWNYVQFRFELAAVSFKGPPERKKILTPVRRKIPTDRYLALRSLRSHPCAF